MPDDHRPDIDTASAFSLVLTGHRGTEGRSHPYHVALFDSKPVRLTNGPFVLLAQLAEARLTSYAGYLQLRRGDDPNTLRLGIHRLRRQIDAALGAEAGMEWVETGMGTEYRLAVSVDNLGVDPGFSEIPWSLLAEDLRDLLVERCHVVESDTDNAIAAQSPRNGRAFQGTLACLKAEHA